MLIIWTCPRLNRNYLYVHVLCLLKLYIQNFLYEYLYDISTNFSSNLPLNFSKNLFPISLRIYPIESSNYKAKMSPNPEKNERERIYGHILTS